MPDSEKTILQSAPELEQLCEENVRLRRSITGLSASVNALKEALAQANKQFATVLDTVSEGFFTLDADLRVTYFNKAAEALLGRSAQEVLGQKLFDAFPEARGSVFEEMYTRALTRKEALTFETYFGLEPYTNWYECRVYPTEDGIAVYFQIITERKLAEESLHESERMLKSILSASPVGIGLSRDRTMRWANDAWLKMFGFKDQQEIVGLNNRVLYPSQEEYDRVGKLLYHSIKTGDMSEADATLKRKDGSTFHALIRMKPIDTAGPNVEHIAAISDISDRKRAEEALKESEQRLELALFGANLGLWDIYLPSGNIVVDRRALAIIGYVPGEVEQTVKSWARLLHLEDRNRALETVDDYLQGASEHYENEYRIRAKSGEWKWVLSRGRITERDADGAPLRMTGTWLDITDRKKAERALIENEARYRTLVESMTNGVAIYEVVGDADDFIFRDMNRAGEIISGISKEDFIGKRVTEVFPGIKELGLFDAFQQTWRTGEPSHVPVNEYRDDRIAIWVENSVCKLPCGDIVAVFSDETERVRAQRALADSEEKYRLVVEKAHEAIIIAQDGMHRFVNPEAVELFGYTQEKLLARPFLEFVHPEDRDMVREHHMKRMSGEEAPNRYAFRIVRKDGIVKSVEIDSAMISWEGRPAALVFMTDISERLRKEEALKESEEWYRRLVEESFDGIFVHDGNSILFANSRLHEMLGYTPGDLVGQSPSILSHPDFRDIVKERAAARMRGEEVISRFELKLLRKDGASLDAEIIASAITVKGKPGVRVWLRDISERKRSQEVQRRLATAIDQAAEAVVITDTQGNVQYVNPACERITGYTLEEVLNRKPGIFSSGQHDAAFYKDLWDTILRGDVWTGRFINKRKDGRLYHEDATISPVRSSSGKIVNFVAVKRDITEQLDLSRQLLQAQKMEAVGTLAGGIAHDFNNLLQVVLGYSELLLTDREMGPQFVEDLARINRAAKTGSELVQRLLTFSRKSETRPRPLNLNRSIVQIQKLLTRTLPKMVQIELSLKPHLLSINADPTQMEQIVMNLAVNARDAMPAGGKLIIETYDVVLDEDYCRTHVGPEPGHYVVLQVSDSGKGMDKVTLEHIFEPFYTTKGPGEGTGLGLAIVYGIVKQHKGHLQCYSEPGKGTTFKIYLPVVTPDKHSVDQAPKPMFRGGSETILVVDDEEFVRELGVRMLQKVGYTVLTATNGKQGIEMYRAHREAISLVVLDLIMPEMGGDQCLEALLKINPAVKVVMASGYSVSGPTKEALEAGAKGFVSKPYAMRQLLETVRDVLDTE